MVNCSGSSRLAPNVVGAGGAVGTGCALARGTGTARRISGVSEGLGEARFFGVGDFSAFPAPFFFFFAFGVASFSTDFFFGVASGVSFGVADGVASSSAVFFFTFGDGEPDFGLCGEAFNFALGLGDSVGSGVSLGFAFGLGAGDASFFDFDFCLAVFAFAAAGLGDSSGDGDAVARAFSTCARFSSSVNCAWTNVPTIALSANRTASQNRRRPTAAHRNRAWGAINPERFRVTREKSRS